jgi:uncharacterized protein
MDRKIILISVLLLIIPFSYSVKIEGFVNDYAGIIDAGDEAELNIILKELYDSGAAEYAVVTVSSLEGKAIESYSLELAQGVLGNKEKNNGLLLLISVDDKKYRFEVGRGIEYILNDAKVGRIGREYLQPNFESGDYGRGIIEASQAVKSILLGDTESQYYVKEEKISPEAVKAILYLILFFVFFILPILAASLKHKKFKNRYFDAAAGAIILFGGRGGRGGFGGSGGFGGFGGGGFGGGGASGGWR